GEGVVITSNLETEAEFTIDELSGPCCRTLFTFVVDLWTTAQFETKDGERWSEIVGSCPTSVMPPCCKKIPDIVDMLGSDWHLNHVPAYWRGFESPVKDAAALKRAVQSSGETNDLAPVEILTSDGPVCLVAPWTLTDYYFDSPDLLLLRNGGSMRLRCNARGWDLLNVKSLSVKLDDAATVRYCSNIPLCPPK